MEIRQTSKAFNCQIDELQEKFWNYGYFENICLQEDGDWWLIEKYPAKKRRYGFFICDKCHEEFMWHHNFQKILISKIKSINSLYPFENLIKTNQDIVDFGAICLMQGIYGFGKSRAVELASIMKEYGYDLKLTGRRTQEGLKFLISRFKGKHKKNGNWTMTKRRTGAIKSSMKIASILNEI